MNPKIGLRSARLYPPLGGAIMSRMNDQSQHPRRSRAARGWRGLLGTLATLVATASVQAQDFTKPPEVDKGWIQWALFAAVLVLVGLIVFKNPKRSHLD
jgi:hypothetical protein